MRRMTGALLAGAMTLGIAQAADAKTYYWISHGSPADPVWTYFLQGAEQWATDTGNTVNTSFHNGDVASHQEAVRAAIAAGADGIVTTSPDPGSLVESRVGHLPGDAERLEDAGDALLLLHAVGGAGHLDRHPDEIA